jgi:hypothetical protein
LRIRKSSLVFIAVLMVTALVLSQALT